MTVATLGLARGATLQSLIDQVDFKRARSAIARRLAANANDAEALFYRGACALHEAAITPKVLQQAEADFAEAATLQPQDVRFINAQAAVCLLLNEPEKSLELSEEALALNAEHVPALTNQVVALLRLKKWTKALPPAELLAKLDPDSVQTRQLVAEALRRVGRFSGALSWYEALQDLQGDLPHNRLDMALCVNHIGDYRAAMAIIAPLLDAPDQDAAYFLRLGVQSQEGASPQLALQFFKRGQALFPQDVTLLVNLGITVQAMGNPGEALFYFQQAAAIDEQCEAAWYYAALSHQTLRDKVQAEACFERALKCDPKHAWAMASLAGMRKDVGKLDEAKDLLRKAIENDPKALQFYLNLYGFLQEAGDYDDADKVLDDAEALELDAQQLRQPRASLMLKRGDITGANALYREIMAAEPENPDAMSGLLFTSNYDPELTPEQIAEGYRSWNRRFVQWRAPGPNFKFANTPQPKRKIKLGYVSGDFKQHSVAFFSEPLLANHDHEQYEVYCYANQKSGDPITQRMMGMADYWRWTADLPDDALVEMIRLDGIDILIDLSNHTALHRLYLFGRKPAPIQMTTLGMPTTTGLTAIDYRITDEWMDPPGLTEALHSEKLMRILSGWCYKPSHEAVDLPVQVAPSVKNGYLTFASFNAFGKINPNVFELWGRLLQEIPDALLVVATGGREDDEKLNTQVRKTCEDCGVPLERLRLLGRKSFKDYMEYHHEVDIVLDSFPYTGATVTAHALWMGVPVITLSGPSPIHRSATSMMTVIGHPEFVASTHDEYIAIAARWSKDLGGLAEQRQVLRSEMQASPLMDGPRVTRDLESKLRTVWQDWCKIQKPKRKRRPQP